MADTIFTRALRQAAQFQASTQALAFALRVPEGTLLRWMAGRAQMPVRAFHELVRLLCEHEARSQNASTPSPAVERVKLNIGALEARCPGCGGTEFLAAVQATELRMTSALRCASCNEPVMHGDLLRALATASAMPARAMLVRRNRQHSPCAPARLPGQP